MPSCKNVLAQAGASLYRDAVDQRIISYLKSLGKEGQIFKTEADAGGQPNMPEGKAGADSDGDGIPDKWETAHRLNPKDPADAAAVKNGGYTRLEEYFHQLLTTGGN
ncbi:MULTISPECIES: hypothetical protein [Niastella]|uniref:Pectate lyase n=1 Tax=Niastella soli TaxID=2821487 RepID=A0ABS3YX31_9BACT|nr:hypothetical protein [Niastella soli]MBO9202489.1 hypothetical protein [Niastella soli]